MTSLPMVPPHPFLSLTCPVSGVSLEKMLTETARTRILRGWVGVQHLPSARGYQRVVNCCQTGYQPADNPGFGWYQ